jgi:MsuE subfamily FMN reductase
LIGRLARVSSSHSRFTDSDQFAAFWTSSSTRSAPRSRAIRRAASHCWATHSPPRSVGSPAYRATYSGLFKLFFDYVGQYALVDTPVVLTATGGSDRHALLVEHQMRPLFGFFQALTLPLGIFANERDFTDYRVTSDDLDERIETSLSRALPLVRSQLVANAVAREPALSAASAG